MDRVNFMSHSISLPVVVMLCRRVILSLISLFCICLLSSYLLGYVEAEESGDAIIITEPEIRAMKAHKMSDLLNHLPGVTAGDSSVGIHGSYKVKVFVDGRSINDPSSSHGGINWDMVSPDEVERIEILRGKGGSRYGQDASGGVILITTRRIGGLTGNIKTYGGNNSTAYGYANLQKNIGMWGLALSGGGETTDGYTLNNDKRRYQAGAKLECSFDEERQISLSADYLDDERGLTGLPEYPTPSSRKSTQNSSVSMVAVYGSLRGTTSFNEGVNHNSDTDSGLDKRLRVNELSQELSRSFKTERWGELNMGGNFIMGRASGSSFDDQQEERCSTFLSDSFKFKELPISLSSALRANFNSEFGDAVNPELKLTYKKVNWHATAGWSRTDNIPSFYQRYNQTSSTLPNPDLDMESADNYSVSLFIEPWDTISGSISLFYNRLNDRITYVTGDDGVGQYQNFGLVTYKGADLALSWQVLDEVKVNGSYTYLEAIDEESNLWLPAQSRHKTRLNIYWQPTEPLTIVSTAQYNSRVYRNKSNTSTVPEYVTATVRAEYAFTRFTIFTEIENVFDTTYYYSDGLLAPPLTWFIGVNYKI